MICKKEFIKAIDTIKEYQKRLEILRQVSHDLTIGIGEVADRLPDTVIRLLCISCGLNPDEKYGDIISWWIYETDFGANKKMNKIYIGKKKFVLNTMEDLYNFIVEYELDKKV